MDEHGNLIDGERYSLSPKKGGRSKAAIYGTVWAAVNSTLPALYSIFVFAYASKIIGPEDFGIFALATGICTTISCLSPGGFGDALVQKTHLKRSHLSTVFSICVLMSVFMLVVSVAISYYIAILSSYQQLPILILILSAKMMFDTMSIVPNSILIRNINFRSVAYRTVIGIFFSGLLSIILLKHGYGVLALAISQVSASAIACIGSLISAQWRPSVRFDRDSLRSLSQFGLYSTGNRILLLVYPEQILIGYLLGAVQLGVFSFGKRIFQILNDVVSSSVGSVASSLFASMQTEYDKVRQAFLLSTYFVAVLGIALFGGLILVADDLVKAIFDEKWVVSVVPLQSFCVIGVLSSVGTLQAALINSQGGAKWWFYYQLTKNFAQLIMIVSLFNAGINMISISMAAINVLLWPLTIRKSVKILNLKISIYARQFLWPIFAFFVMTTCVIITKDYLQDQPPMRRLIACVTTGGLLYTVLILSVSRNKIFQVLVYLRQQGAK